MNVFRERLSMLREMMTSKGWDAVIMTGTDPHCSEYPAPRWKCVEWLSGFTGEAGDIVVTKDHAGLWTDTRYFIQAVQQLEGTGVVLHKTKVPDEVLIPQWLCTSLDMPHPIVAVDSLCQSIGTMDELEGTFRSRFGEGGYEFRAERDLLSEIWTERPAIPHTPIEVLDKTICGESREEKIAWLQNLMKDKGIDHSIICALDQIAWILDVRAGDIDYNPYIISYLAVSQDKVKWFVRSHEEVPSLEGIEVLPYRNAELYCSTLEGRIAVEPDTCNWAIFKALEGKNPVQGSSPINLKKAVKNEVEIKGFREIYIEDGLAMEKFLYWLDDNVSKGAEISEWQASKYLTALRAAIPGYRGDSFDTISAYGPGAALPHYITPREGSSIIRGKGLYLVDSGGHYLKGTTDITRTVPMGECTELEKEDYTLVLKGMIQLSMAVFPEGTPGCRIDALAREPLWRSHRNFGHGTGHGTGFFLGVHEGPQSIRQDFNRQSMTAGMVTSNEPGLYREGLHGIRHENVLLCVEDGESEFGKWLRFETLTCCHIDTAPIIRELLSEEERSWLNAYNRRVFRTLSPRLDPRMAGWLRRKSVSI